MSGDRDSEAWQIIRCDADIVVWVHLYEADLVLIQRPQGYDWWEIRDSTNQAVGGPSLAPFRSLDAAIERVNQDLPGIEL